jgi:hypothetical protein
MCEYKVSIFNSFFSTVLAGFKGGGIRGFVNQRKQKEKESVYLSFVRFIFVPPASEISGKQLLSHFLLLDNVIHRRLLRVRLHCVDGGKRKSEKATSISLCKLLRELFRQLDSLVFYYEAAEIQHICTDGTAGRRRVAIGNLPSFRGQLLEGAGA